MSGEIPGLQNNNLLSAPFSEHTGTDTMLRTDIHEWSYLTLSTVSWAVGIILPTFLVKKLKHEEVN